MEGAPPERTCPQCKAKNESIRARCSVCGSELLFPEGAALQPAFELELFGPARGGRQDGSWLSRGKRVVMALCETAWSISLSPSASFSSFRMESEIFPPLLYALLLGGPFLLLDLEMKAALSADRRWLSWPLAVMVFFVAPPSYVYLRAQALHLALVLQGGAKRPFVATFRVVAYSNASLGPLLAVPLAGDFLFLVAGTVVEATGIRICQRLSLAGAVMLELVLAAALLLGLLAVLFLRLLWWSQTRG